MRFILDANVVVSGFIARRADTPPKMLLEALKVGAFESVGSDALVAEWREVVTRPRVLRYTRQSREDALAALAAVEVLTRMISAPSSQKLPPDPNDSHLWAILAADSETVLVTGDTPLLDAPFAPSRVITPRHAVERLQNAGGIVIGGA